MPEAIDVTAELLLLLSAVLLTSTYQGTMLLRSLGLLLVAPAGAHIAFQVPFRPQFETTEHAFLGDHVTLRLSDQHTISGSDFSFDIKGSKLSFGEIVSLAGDYFGAWDISQCPKQICDGYQSNPSSSVKRFEEIASLMRNEQAKDLECIQNALREMRGEFCPQVSAGRDPVQVYKNISSYYDSKFVICTRGRYLALSLCNWDHFGEDAFYAYQAGHTAAINKAFLASNAKDVTALRDAYFLEAFALHFLTDLFSAGHLRTPRRTLHQSLQELGKPWPADQLTRAMHDEDCASGLWVTNALGESWAVYGDKELSAMKSFRNLDQVIAAAQIGVDEIWWAYWNGSKTAVKDFGAVKKAPTLASLTQNRNFSPLFYASSSASEFVYRRKDLGDRSSPTRVSYRRSELNQGIWHDNWEQVQSSGPKSKPFPATIDGLLPEIRMLQYQSINSTHILINQYSPLMANNYNNQKLNFCKLKPEAGKQRRSWGLLNQSYIQVPDSARNVGWQTVTSLTHNITIISGFKPVEGKARVYSYLAISAGQVLWSYDGATISSDVESVTSYVAQFTTERGSIAIVQQNNKPSDTDASLHVFINGVEHAPQPSTSPWSTSQVTSSFTYKLESGVTALVSVSFDKNEKALKWHLSTWLKGYAAREETEIVEASVPEAPQKFLVYGDYILRVFHSDASSSSPNFKVESVKITSTVSGNKLTISLLSTNLFPVTWDPATVYTSWLLAPLTSPSSPSLVALLTHPITGALTTLAFAPGPDNTFLKPVIKAIDHPSLSTFTAPYLPSIQVQVVNYFHRATNQPRPGALLQLFDNFGVLGARIMSPGDYLTDKLEFRVLGQTPAIAGQTSKAIGFIFQDVSS